jgi:hypothetical protein
MPFVPFYEKFPDLAIKETRVLNVLNHPGLPSDEYGLLELYCDEPGCDCRRVMFNIQRPNSPQPDAVVAFGWESAEFYIKWLDGLPADIKELQGPILNLGSYQSRLAPILLQQMTLILQDDKYVERLQRHYAIFRAEVERGAGTSSRRQLPPKRRKTSRKLR